MSNTITHAADSRTPDAGLESALKAMGARPRKPQGQTPAALPTLTDEWRGNARARPASQTEDTGHRTNPASEGGHPWAQWRQGLLAVLLVALVVLVAAGLAYDRSSWLRWLPADAVKAAATPSSAGEPTVAVVNGKPIVADELASLMASGVDRAVAVDRTINKAVAADAARSVFPAQAAEAVRTAEREVLANLFLQRRTQELMQGIDDAQISAYYASKVHDDDYASFSLRYYLTRDAADAHSVKTLLDSGDRAAQARLSPLMANGQRQLSPQAVPYGLGQIVRKAKPGEVLGPLLVRDGYLLLVLDERRDGKKPALADVKNEIRAVIAGQRLGDELRDWRQKARIELR